MADLRVQIDRLDESLVELLSQRQRYIERAAEIKAYRHQIRDETRIADVLAKVTKAAATAGLDPKIAQAVWRTLVESSIQLEMARFEALSASNNSE